MSDNTDNNTVYYCPACGKPMTFQGMQPAYKGGIEIGAFPVLACKDNPVCPMHLATVSLGCMFDDQFYDGWKVKRVYSPATGQRINDNG